MSVVDYRPRIANKGTYVREFLSLDSSNEIIGDYSGGVTEFSYTNVSSTQTLFINNILVKVLDEGQFLLSDYGSIGAELTNGINIYYTTDSGATKNYIVGTTNNIKNNSDFFNYTNDINLKNSSVGDSIIGVNFNFFKNYTAIKLTQDESIVIEVNDDFSNITSQVSQITGYLYDNTEL